MGDDRSCSKRSEVTTNTVMYSRQWKLIPERMHTPDKRDLKQGSKYDDLPGGDQFNSTAVGCIPIQEDWQVMEDTNCHPGWKVEVP